MPLGNWIMLDTGETGRFHFTDHSIQNRTITDPITGGATSRNTLVLEVDEFDGKAVAAKYSTMAEKHFAQFEPYLGDKSYRDFTFVITPIGDGFRRTWSFQVLPRE